MTVSTSILISLPEPVGWNPLASAGAGAGFGGVLAALVIIVSVQLALDDPSEDGRHGWASLAAATPTLGILLLATYLYIMLAGMPNTQEIWSSADAQISTVSEVQIPESLAAQVPVLTDAEILALSAEEVQALSDAQISALSDEKISALKSVYISDLTQGYANIAARGFSMAGSVLALGALLTIFLVAAAIREGLTSRQGVVAKGYAEAVLIISVFVIGYILLWGYDTGAKLVQITPGLGWWTVHISLVFVPVLLSLVATGRKHRTALVERMISFLSGTSQPSTPRGEHVSRRSEPPRRSRVSGPVFLSIFWALVLPCALVVSAISRGPNDAGDGVVLLTSGFAAFYFGTCSAVMLLVYRRSPDPRPLHRWGTPPTCP